METKIMKNSWRAKIIMATIAVISFSALLFSQNTSFKSDVTLQVGNVNAVKKPIEIENVFKSSDSRLCIDWKIVYSNLQSNDKQPNETHLLIKEGEAINEIWGSDINADTIRSAYIYNGDGTSKAQTCFATYSANHPANPDYAQVVGVKVKFDCGWLCGHWYNSDNYSYSPASFSTAAELFSSPTKTPPANTTSTVTLPQISNIRVISLPGKRVNIMWNNNVALGSNQFFKVQVFANQKLLQELTSNTNSIEIPNLTTNTTYDFLVMYATNEKTVDNSQSGSTYTYIDPTIIPTTTTAPTPTTAPVTANATGLTKIGLRVYWPAINGAASYFIFGNDDISRQILDNMKWNTLTPITTNEFYITGAVPGTNYSFQTFAKDNNKNELSKSYQTISAMLPISTQLSPSTQAGIQTSSGTSSLATPFPVTNLRATIENTNGVPHIRLTWDDTVNENGKVQYFLSIKNSNNPNGDIVGNSSPTYDKSMITRDLSYGQTYTYGIIVQRNTTGNIATSNFAFADPISTGENPIIAANAKRAADEEAANNIKLTKTGTVTSKVTGKNITLSFQTPSGLTASDVNRYTVKITSDSGETIDSEKIDTIAQNTNGQMSYNFYANAYNRNYTFKIIPVLQKVTSDPATAYANNQNNTSSTESLNAFSAYTIKSGSEPTGIVWNQSNPDWFPNSFKTLGSIPDLGMCENTITFKNSKIKDNKLTITANEKIDFDFTLKPKSGQDIGKRAMSMYVLNDDKNVSPISVTEEYNVKTTNNAKFSVNDYFTLISKLQTYKENIPTQTQPSVENFIRYLSNYGTPNMIGDGSILANIFPNKTFSEILADINNPTLKTIQGTGSITVGQTGNYYFGSFLEKLGYGETIENSNHPKFLSPCGLSSNFPKLVVTLNIPQELTIKTEKVSKIPRTAVTNTGTYSTISGLSSSLLSSTAELSIFDKIFTLLNLYLPSEQKHDTNSYSTTLPLSSEITNTATQTSQTTVATSTQVTPSERIPKEKYVIVSKDTDTQISWEVNSSGTLTSCNLYLKDAAPNSGIQNSSCTTSNVSFTIPSSKLLQFNQTWIVEVTDSFDKKLTKEYNFYYDKTIPTVTVVDNTVYTQVSPNTSNKRITFTCIPGDSTCKSMKYYVDVQNTLITDCKKVELLDTDQVSKFSTCSSTGPCEQSIPYDSGKTYSVCAIATNEAGTKIYSDLKNFIFDTLPAVVAPAPKTAEPVVTQPITAPAQTTNTTLDAISFLVNSLISTTSYDNAIKSINDLKAMVPAAKILLPTLGNLSASDLKVANDVLTLIQNITVPDSNATAATKDVFLKDIQSKLQTVVSNAPAPVANQVTQQPPHMTGDVKSEAQIIRSKLKTMQSYLTNTNSPKEAIELLKQLTSYISSIEEKMKTSTEEITNFGQSISHADFFDLDKRIGFFKARLLSITIPTNTGDLSILKNFTSTVNIVFGEKIPDWFYDADGITIPIIPEAIPSIAYCSNSDGKYSTISTSEGDKIICISSNGAQCDTWSSTTKKCEKWKPIEATFIPQICGSQIPSTPKATIAWDHSIDFKTAKELNISINKIAPDVSSLSYNLTRKDTSSGVASGTFFGSDLYNIKITHIPLELNTVNEFVLKIYYSDDTCNGAQSISNLSFTQGTPSTNIPMEIKTPEALNCNNNGGIYYIEKNTEECTFPNGYTCSKSQLLENSCYEFDKDKTFLKQSICVDSKCEIIRSLPSITNLRQQYSINNPLVWNFNVIDDDIPLRKITTTIQNIETGEKIVKELPIKLRGFEVTVNPDEFKQRPGGKYTITINLENTVSDTQSPPFVSSVVTLPQTQKDAANPLLKNIPGLSSLPGETAKVTMRFGNNISIVANDVPKGEKISLDDIINKGVNSVTNQKMTKLPSGKYQVDVESGGLKQTIEYKVDPYFFDTNGDINGDGKNGGIADYMLYQLGEKTGVYSTTDNTLKAEINYIKDKISAQLNVDARSFFKN